MQQQEAAAAGSGWFDCNICLEAAREPVVTLCGHLYCWPCIYQWLHVQSAALRSDEPPTCPVCKAHASHTAMIPLFSRAAGSKPHSLAPPRPTALSPASPVTGQRLPYRNPYQSREIVADDGEEESSAVGGVFGGLVYAHLSAYGHAGGGGRRRRRIREVHVDKSLNRVSIFLFCCLLLCLLVF